MFQNTLYLPVNPLLDDYRTGHPTEGTMRLLNKFYFQYLSPVDAQGCILWIGETDEMVYRGKKRSYGFIRLVLGWHLPVNKVAYYLAYGPINNDTKLIQTCRNTLCCNPVHLRIKE